MIRSLAILLPLVAVSIGAEFHFGTQTLTVPDGYVVELVAGPPLVDRPIEAAFDEQGRLYVTDVTGTNIGVEKQLVEKPHRVLRLESTKGDGHFDKRTVFADGLGFPEGCLWHDGSLYVAAPPQIWKFTDTKGDGVADKRELWFDGKTLTHCANDMHGPYLGPDGWIYWCKGAFAEQTNTLADGRELKSKASHIFRRRPEGGPIESVLTGGMDNPVGLAFSAAGERFLSCTFFQNPANGQRDGLIHAIYGGVYGKQHGVLDGHARTSADLMPVLAHLGPAAACGLMRAESDALGFRDQLFACSFNLKRVSRHELVPAGASFTTRDSDFLVSDSTDFHPTDVLEDADGSVLIIDTGGWYKICCPTSQLHKPDVLGAIYRVRKQGAQKVGDPRGLALDWKAAPAELVKRLADPRPAVRERAKLALGKAGDSAVAPLAALQQDQSPQVRREAVWALTQVSGAAARQAIHAALDDSDATVQQAALHGVSVWRDRTAAEAVTKLLDAASPAVRRTAAEALGRTGADDSVAALLRAKGGNDRILEHSLTYALLELARPAAVRAALASSDPAARRRAIIALDQTPEGDLKAADIVPHLSAEDQPLREAARWIAGRHPEWSPEIVTWLRAAVAAKSIDMANVETLIVALASSPAAQELVAGWADANQPVELRIPALRAMGRAGLAKPAAAWFQALASAIETGSPEVRRVALDTSAILRDRKAVSPILSDALLQLATKPSADADGRLAALAALPDPLKPVDGGVFDLLRSRLAPGQPMLARRNTAALLKRVPLTEAQWHELAKLVPDAEPASLGDITAIFENCPAEAVGRGLLDGLRKNTGASKLPADALRKAFAKFPEPLRDEALQLAAGQGTDAKKQRARLDELASFLSKGDPRRGQVILRSVKTACTSCHAIAYIGGNFGPDLTHIGKIRTERDILEAIVFPSASFVRSYEPMIVKTKSGAEIPGIIRADNATEVVLAVGPGVETHLPRADVKSIEPGAVSLMPQGYDGILTPQEIADLVTFLKSSM